jgi:carbonic anhydrase
MRLSRVTALRALSAGIVAPAALADAATAAAPPSSYTPASALAALLAGNERYRKDAGVNCNNHYDRRQQISAGQTPFAIVLGCADSRVPPEVIFDARLGELFVVRVAGNIAGDFGIGSIEYALEHFHSPILMVLGHEKCGAVAATLDAVKAGETVPGYIGTLVTAIEPAVKRSLHENGDVLHDAVLANVSDVVKRLGSASKVVAAATAAGKLHVVGASYDLSTGAVTLV